MAMKRVDFALEWVQRRTRFTDTKRRMEVTPELILFEMADVQDAIARDALALPFKKILVTAENVDRYSTGIPIYKMGSIKTPVGWPEAIIITTPLEWDMVRKAAPSLTTPTYYFFEGNILTIYPTPTESSLEIEVHAYGLPDREDVVPGKDFALDERFDKAIRYGTLSEFDDSFYEKYRRELDEQIAQGMNRSASAPLLIDNNARSIGF